jgi:hypothetical protein
VKLGREVREGDQLAADFEHVRGLRMRGTLFAMFFGLVIWAGIAPIVVAVCS